MISNTEFRKQGSTKNVVTIINPKTKKEVSFFIEPWIKNRFDKKIIPDLEEKNKDCVIVIDGKEGSGKSTLGLQWCKYIDPSFNLSRVVFSPEEFREAIYKAKKGQSVMFDEAFTGFSSRSALSGVNRTLNSLMMQIRQKNLFVVIILPTFFLLDKYISLFRARVLVHVYENSGRRGFFRVYSSNKKRLLIMDKKARTYSYGIRTKKKGRFYGVFALCDCEDEKTYIDNKLKALEMTEKNPISSSGVKYREQRDLILYILRKETKMSYRQMETMLNGFDFDISYRQIASICVKFGDKMKEVDIIDEKKQESSV
ncbi:MAG TPA: hypothetical protein ENI61_06280 [Ignavibacteria bacterium]|nr:hypothetical protein [Ignavibacteria bacterium]